MSDGGAQGGEVLQFTLPSFPTSFNRLYFINHNRRQVSLSDEALLWRTRSAPFVKACRWPSDWWLKLTLEYQSPAWLTKAGKAKRADISNFEKLIVDTMFMKWGWDDCRIIELISKKAWGEREQVHVTLEHVEINLSAPIATPLELG